MATHHQGVHVTTPRQMQAEPGCGMEGALPKQRQDGAAFDPYQVCAASPTSPPATIPATKSHPCRVRGCQQLLGGLPRTPATFPRPPWRAALQIDPAPAGVSCSALSPPLRSYRFVAVSTAMKARSRSDDLAALDLGSASR